MVEKTYSIDDIDFEGGALSTLGFGMDSWSVVRKTFDGNFAVIGKGRKPGTYRIIKVLPNLDRAKAYNRAIHS